ncbi:DUF948 domain-containing protein [Niallia sp. 01092]|uniref:DUF948 domain-containing protein n=1 Tax=unclassified Niallia TaxID=2837522 RepID=UPI003FD2261F
MVKLVMVLSGGAIIMIDILYWSVALIAIAFTVLVIYLAKTLKSLHITLDSVSKTLSGLERQLDGVTRETTVLLEKTNHLAADIQQKSESLNSVVDAVKGVGESVRGFNQSVQSITNNVETTLEKNQDKISQIVQWSNIAMNIRDQWNSRREMAKRKTN